MWLQVSEPVLVHEKQEKQVKMRASTTQTTPSLLLWRNINKQVKYCTVRHLQLQRDVLSLSLSLSCNSVSSPRRTSSLSNYATPLSVTAVNYAYRTHYRRESAPCACSCRSADHIHNCRPALSSSGTSLIWRGRLINDIVIKEHVSFKKRSKSQSLANFHWKLMTMKVRSRHRTMT